LYEIAKGENALKVFDFRRFRAFQMKQDHWIKHLAVEVCCGTSEKMDVMTLSLIPLLAGFQLPG